MLKKNLVVACLLLFCVIAAAQNKYTASMRYYQAKYVADHEVVKKADKKFFRFFPVDAAYNVKAVFEKVNDSIGFTMKTSAGTLQEYYKYGRLHFSIHDTTLYLFVYQGKELMKTDHYKDYLFVPFTDLTTGDESYGSGRYLEFYKADIVNNSLQLDFNKAYNPYCAYATGFHCPIPPKENNIAVAIKAGEKLFAKPYHH